MKLPVLPLPEYSHGRDELLEDFFERFENILNKYSLTEYEKFIYLERQITREPLVLIKSLKTVDQSYSEAKALLMKAFASESIKKFDAIRRLMQLSSEVRKKYISLLVKCEPS